ncbi:MAG: VWA domain-containing protein [Spirochaetota bacterium]|nr:VWA domain-containing protein [Spirochaetota bacterium]
MLKEEIGATVHQIGKDGFHKQVFEGFQIEKTDEEALLTSLLTGHHLLIVGPPGSGKSDVAARIGRILDDIEVVEGCPINCHIDDATCPWCLDKKAQGVKLKTTILPSMDRIKKVQGSAGLVVEDLIGDLDPDVALREGSFSPKAFIPGKLLRANRGVLIIDFIDRAPERVLNTIISTLQGDTVTIGPLNKGLKLDTMIIATGTEKVLKVMPMDISDCFDIIRLDFVDDPIEQEQIIIDKLKQLDNGKDLEKEITDKVVEIVNRTRTHMEVKRGISTRGMIKYSELLTSFPQLDVNEEVKKLKEGSIISLPHRLELSHEADTPGKRDRIINEIVDEVSGVSKPKEELVTLSKDDVFSLVEELVSEDSFRIPLKYGAFDLLLKRIHNFPDSKLAELYRETLKKLREQSELYPDRERSDNVTEDLLEEYEEERKRDVRLKDILEEQAMMEMLSLLEAKDILEQGSIGFGLSLQGITFLLEKLTPTLTEDNYSFGYGKHSTGKKSVLGEGKIIGKRHYRFGDRYRDISQRDTMRQAIRNRRTEITREDIMVLTKDIRTKMNIVLLIDLSGTMRQIKKLWYAKQSAIALALATARYKDNVGVVTFSNLADIVVDCSGNPHHVARKILDQELHENAFTNIGYGLSKACTLLAHHPKGDAKQHIILISDGDATAPHPSPQKHALKQASSISRRGITISSVCIAQQTADPELMRRIAKIGKGRLYYIGAEELASALLEEAAVLHTL